MLEWLEKYQNELILFSSLLTLNAAISVYNTNSRIHSKHIQKYQTPIMKQNSQKSSKLENAINKPGVNYKYFKKDGKQYLILNEGRK